MSLSLKQKICNLVENFPDTCHAINISNSTGNFPNALVEELKEKGYKVRPHGDNLHISVSKDENFKHITRYHEYAMFIIPENPCMIVKMVNGVLVNVVSDFLYANNEAYGRQSASMVEAFLGYDVESETIPEPWMKLFLSIYGKAMPVTITYSYKIKKYEEKQRTYTPSEFQLHKLN